MKTWYLQVELEIGAVVTLDPRILRLVSKSESKDGFLMSC